MAPAIPTGLKWSTVHKAASEDGKYVICNADEGDPGAFMDRSVLESDPHRVLEGMAIAAYAIGASKGYIYVRAEYPLAVKRLQTTPSDRRSESGCWAMTFATLASASGSRSASVPERSSVARKRRSSPPSKASAGSRARARPIPRKSDCGAPDADQ